MQKELTSQERLTHFNTPKIEIKKILAEEHGSISNQIVELIYLDNRIKYHKSVKQSIIDNISNEDFKRYNKIIPKQPKSK